MTITHLHIRFMATRLLLVETLRLLSDTDAVLWKTTVEERLIELGALDGPIPIQVAEVVQEYVGNLDFFRREDL